MNELYEIYHLSDPRDQSIRYVGMSKDAKRRLQRHLTQKDNPLMPWFKELAALGLKPILTIIETIQGKQQAKERETYWIKYYAEQGAHLENYQGNAAARSKWKERQGWLNQLTEQYSFIEDPQERQFVIAVFLEMNLTKHYNEIDYVWDIVQATTEEVQRNHHIDVTWREFATIMAKILQINLEQCGSEAAL